MKSEVYFYGNVNNLKPGLNKFLDIISKEFGEDTVAFKIHFGEDKNTTHINPEILRDIPKYFKKPLFVDCNVLYKGSRTRKSDHIALAKKHGFDFIPIDILDGELGEDTIEVPIKTKNTKIAKLGKGLEKYKKMVALTHFKGHGMTGFGGALKNVGMGLGSRGGKLDMHSSLSPQIDIKRCIGCSICVQNCPAKAIELVLKRAKINKNKCIGCAMCIAVCPNSAISSVLHDNLKLMEKIAEYTLAATKGKKWFYINFLTNITYFCDCRASEQKPFMKDIGILFSKDPVAIDQASIDLVVENNKGVDPFKKNNGVDGTYILDYAEKIGLGKRDYKLIKVD